jgi:hypothetical protein
MLLSESKVAICETDENLPQPVTVACHGDHCAKFPVRIWLVSSADWIVVWILVPGEKAGLFPSAIKNRPIFHLQIY